MADQYTSMENLRFWVFEVHKAEDLFAFSRYADYDKESVDILLDSIKDLTDKEYFPYFSEMDEKGAYYKDGGVIVHPQIDNIIKKTAEIGWVGAIFDYETGGMQLPETVYLAGNHIMECANNSVTGYLGLTTGSASLIVSFGSDKLKETYVPKMMSGEWMGTMALTEPQAGSALSYITTSAKPTGDGFYKIEGQKIFISGGDHQFSENFVHLTLARIEGAPEGVRGISLFVVPKFRPKADGSLENNDVIIAGDFQKMGQKGYCTTHLVYGENDNCHGWLVGEPNMGLKYMFQMMNAARIDVGATAAGAATAAYHASLQYANERSQGTKLTKTTEKGQTSIINHPDIKRMLLLQKAISEGAMSLLFECTKLHDMQIAAEDDKAGDYHLLLELLTPIAKTYPSEAGQRSISNGLQILGGYGFCIDFPLQQYYRDIRIMSLYEGTTGIQSLDLLGRKMTMKDGRASFLLAQEIQKTITAAIVHDELKPYAKILGEKLFSTANLSEHLLAFAKKGDMEHFLADATLFMDFMSTLVIAWQWLKMATVAQEALQNNTATPDFYKGKLHIMKFYYTYEVPKMAGLAETIKSELDLTVGDEVLNFL